MDELDERPSTRTLGIRYGLILSVINIVYFLVLTVAGIDMTSGFGRWASVVFFIAIIYLAHKEFIRDGDGFMSFGQGMGITFWTGAISSLIYSCFFYTYVKFVDESFVDMLKDKQIEEMQNKGMSDSQIDQAMSIASMFMKPEMMFIFSLVFGLIFIMIIGLVISLITQKSKPDAPF